MSKKNRSHRHSRKPARRKSLLARRGSLFAALAVLVLIVAAIVAFGPRVAQAPANAPAEISVAQAYQEYQQGAFVLDVREVEEWDAFHIPDTTLIPLGQLAARTGELPRDRRIVVVCRTGNRSQEGRAILLAAGFSDVTSMAGGVTSWSRAGYPIEGRRP